MSIFTSVGLILAGVVAIIIELFVPAAGIIGILGLGSIIGGIVTVYIYHGSLLGSIFLAGAVIATPIAMAAYFKYFPRSFMGRWLILNKDTKEGEDSASEGASGDDGRLRELLGKEGVTTTTLRPAGTALISNRKYSVFTSGEFIDKGLAIKVVRVEGNRILVRKGA